MRWLRLDVIAPEKQLMRAKAKRALLRFTDAAIDTLRDDDEEFLQGAWPHLPCSSAPPLGPAQSGLPCMAPQLALARRGVPCHASPSPRLGPLPFHPATAPHMPARGVCRRQHPCPRLWPPPVCLLAQQGSQRRPPGC